MRKVAEREAPAFVECGWANATSSAARRNRQLCAVVKANAYGHGVDRIAPALQACEVDRCRLPLRDPRGQGGYAAGRRPAGGWVSGRPCGPQSASKSAGAAAGSAGSANPLQRAQLGQPARWPREPASLEADLQRRDFSINAMALHWPAGHLQLVDAAADLRARAYGGPGVHHAAGAE